MTNHDLLFPDFTEIERRAYVDGDVRTVTLIHAAEDNLSDGVELTEHLEEAVSTAWELTCILERVAELLTLAPEVEGSCELADGLSTLVETLSEGCGDPQSKKYDAKKVKSALQFAWSIAAGASLGATDIVKDLYEALDDLTMTCEKHKVLRKHDHTLTARELLSKHSGK
jgi:hypothetical protein